MIWLMYRTLHTLGLNLFRALLRFRMTIRMTIVIVMITTIAIVTTITQIIVNAMDIAMVTTTTTTNMIAAVAIHQLKKKKFVTSKYATDQLIAILSHFLQEIG